MGCLPPAGGRFAPKVIKRLRRRLGTEGEGEGVEERAEREGWRVYEAYEVKNKRQKMRCLLLRRKKKISILYITL